MMNLTIIMIVLGAAAGVRLELSDDWTAYKSHHGKVCDGTEESVRRSAWEVNLSIIRHHNIRAELGEFTFKLGMNKFGDLLTPTWSLEGVEAESDYPYTAVASPCAHNISKNAARNYGGFVDVSQDEGALIAAIAMQGPVSVFVDASQPSFQLYASGIYNEPNCLERNPNHAMLAVGYGCAGGTPEEAYSYISLEGLESEADYPYAAVIQQCVHNISKNVAFEAGYGTIGDETSLTKFVGNYAPVSVMVDASPASFQNYQSDSYNDPTCEQTGTHGMLVVGYGVDAIVSNSFGTTWGVNGYMYLARDGQNHCGVASDASYPILPLGPPNK
ncbi:putative Cathepsin L2 [Hypsibius exemplaris]|uniref:Cathepsin L2 n=1 Tax=Hypsibius exemplaris TaxID=2072580 RepID=A0A9X6NRL2_HYPEX|nr:putative Cathepsin L2 [Hypsibius exemplaris]